MAKGLLRIQDTDSAKDVARGPRRVERDLDVIHLRHGDMIILGHAGIL